jgi:hypothetical protein
MFTDYIDNLCFRVILCRSLIDYNNFEIVLVFMRFLDDKIVFFLIFQSIVYTDKNHMHIYKYYSRNRLLVDF